MIAPNLAANGAAPSRAGIGVVRGNIAAARADYNRHGFSRLYVLGESAKGAALLEQKTAGAGELRGWRGGK
jgi:hypothetical protein